MKRHATQWAALIGVILASATATGCEEDPPARGPKKPISVQSTSTAKSSGTATTPTTTAAGTGSLAPSTESHNRPSRYPSNSPVWGILHKVKPEPGQLEAIWFSWGPARRVLESTVATAVSVPWKRVTSYLAINKEFCDKDRSCEITEVLSPKTPTKLKLTSLAGTVRENTREATMATCESRLEGLINDMSSALRDERGVVVIGYVENAFRDSDISDKPGSVHPFTVVRADASRGLFLVDSAESAPFVYNVYRQDVCKFLAAPQASELRFAQRPADRVGQWGINIWTVTGPPPEPPTSGVVDLRTFAVPQDYGSLRRYFVPGLPAPQPFAALRVGVDPREAKSMAKWMDDIESKCGIVAVDENSWRSKCQDTYGILYRGAGTNSDWIKPLAQIFRAGGASASNPRQWEISSIMRFVQEIRYELPSERPHGVRPPEQVLSMHSGDCDTKSLLAAALLDRLDYHAGVVALDQYRHAVLGVAADDMPWVTGGYRVRGPDKKEYIATEMTLPGARPGDPVWTDSPKDPSGAGPKVYPLRER